MQVQQSVDNLQTLLAAESKMKKEHVRKAASRHSRFGTTIAVKLNPNKPRPNSEEDTGNDADGEQSATPSRSFVLHRQQGLNQDASTIWDITKRQKTKKLMMFDELTRQDNLSSEARIVLKNLATDFLESCFNRESRCLNFGSLIYRQLFSRRSLRISDLSDQKSLKRIMYACCT